MARAITHGSAIERRAFEHSLGHGRETQSRGGSLDGITCAGAVSNHKSARATISTEAPPPKSLEVEPGNEASQNDV